MNRLEPTCFSYISTTRRRRYHAAPLNLQSRQIVKKQTSSKSWSSYQTVQFKRRRRRKQANEKSPLKVKENLNKEEKMLFSKLTLRSNIKRQFMISISILLVTLILLPLVCQQVAAASISAASPSDSPNSYQQSVTTPKPLDSRAKEENQLEQIRLSKVVEKYEKNRAISDQNYHILLAIYSLLIVFGTLSNALICLTVILKPQILSPRNIFIVNLAASDLLLCVFTMPFSFIEISTIMWPMGLIPCKLVAGLQATSIYVSTISITAIALDRYKVIVYPTHQETTRGSTFSAASLIASVWILALLLSSPLFHYRTVSHYDLRLPKKKSVDYCFELWPFDHGRRIYSAISMTLQYVLPITIVSVVYAKISDKLQKRLIRRQRSTQLECQQKRQLNLIKRTHTMLVSVSLIFGLSWLPLNLLNVIGDFSDLFKGDDDDQLFRLVFACCHLIGCSSACTNPILYAYLNENFRKESYQVYSHRARGLIRLWGRLCRDARATNYPAGASSTTLASSSSSDPASASPSSSPSSSSSSSSSSSPAGSPLRLNSPGSTRAVTAPSRSPSLCALAGPANNYAAYSLKHEGVSAMELCRIGAQDAGGDVTATSPISESAVGGKRKSTLGGLAPQMMIDLHESGGSRQHLGRTMRFCLCVGSTSSADTFGTSERPAKRQESATPASRGHHRSCSRPEKRESSTRRRKRTKKARGRCACQCHFQEDSFRRPPLTRSRPHSNPVDPSVNQDTKRLGVSASLQFKELERRKSSNDINAHEHSDGERASNNNQGRAVWLSFLQVNKSPSLGPPVKVNKQRRDSKQQMESSFKQHKATVNKSNPIVAQSSCKHCSVNCKKGLAKSLNKTSAKHQNNSAKSKSSHIKGIPLQDDRASEARKECNNNKIGCYLSVETERSSRNSLNRGQSTSFLALSHVPTDIEEASEKATSDAGADANADDVDEMQQRPSLVESVKLPSKLISAGHTKPANQDESQAPEAEKLEPVELKSSNSDEAAKSPSSVRERRTMSAFGSGLELDLELDQAEVSSEQLAHLVKPASENAQLLTTSSSRPNLSSLYACAHYSSSLSCTCSSCHSSSHSDSYSTSSNFDESSFISHSNSILSGSSWFLASIEQQPTKKLNKRTVAPIRSAATQEVSIYSGDSWQEQQQPASGCSSLAVLVGSILRLSHSQQEGHSVMTRQQQQDASPLVTQVATSGSSCSVSGVTGTPVHSLKGPRKFSSVSHDEMGVVASSASRQQLSQLLHRPFHVQQANQSNSVQSASESQVLH